MTSFASIYCHVLLIIALLTCHAEAASQFDFTQSGGAARWTPLHDVGPLKVEPDGLVITITGKDPYIEGPPVKLTSSSPIQARIRLKSDAGGMAQLYFAAKTFNEKQMVSFPVASNKWTDICVPLPPLEKGARFRLDPPGETGKCVVAWMFIEEMNSEGIIHINATSEKLEFSVKGILGDFEIAELFPYESLSDAADSPVVFQGKVGREGKVSIPRFDMGRDRLYSAFVPLQARKKIGKVPVAGAHFVDQFSEISKFKPPFPESKSKKGLQIQMPDDALKLGVQHAAINVDLCRLIDLSHNPANIEWKMDGETYHFHRGYADSLPVKSLSDAGCTVTMILLSYQTGNPQLDSIMLHPKRSDELPNRLAAFNTTNEDGLRHFKACLEFLADRHSAADSPHGRVANYIIGNEVSGHWEWYNMGLAPREVVVAEYERSVRIAHTAIRKYSSSSRVYLSLEHHWTLTFGGNMQQAVAGRVFLEEFNRRAQMMGNFDWNLAYHPYPENLFQPRTWLDKSAMPTIETPRITFKNLDQLVKFFRRSEMLFEGHPRRIILSEQGFHADGTPDGDVAQAAAYCYAWVKVNRLDGIDSFILHRHVDHSGEGGLNLGLWRRKPDSIADPSTPRPMYEVFQKADTPDWEATFKFALPVIGIKSWEELSKK